jgi:HEAT repeat protein
LILAVLAILAILAMHASAPQQARYDDVVRNLRNPDPNIRLQSVRLLRDAQYPEAIVPMAPLVTDPLDRIQLEAIEAELAFFLVEPVPGRKRLGFIVEVRNRGGAAAAFELGPLAVWPRPVPEALADALLKAVDDENPRVRLEAIYALGAIARAPLGEESAAQVIRALDHYDPAIRAAAARVAGRLQVKGAGDALINTLNDSQAEVRFAAMRALGDIREARAVRALADQLEYYGKGEGAWSALDGLARIAHPSSADIFRARLADRDAFLRRAAAEGLGRIGDRSAVAALEGAAVTDKSEMVRLAMAFALHQLGRDSLARLVGAMDDRRSVAQVQAYLLELGPDVEKALLAGLHDPARMIRASVAEVLGEIGGAGALAALQTLQEPDKEVAAAVRRAVERITLRRG